jgi:PhnB protein
MAKPIPEGFHTVTPVLNVKDCDKAIELYKKAFGAEVRGRHDGPDGKVMHAELQIGDSRIMMSEVMQVPPTQSSIWLYVHDADQWWKRATAAGLEVTQAISDMFWGDRWGVLSDKFGTRWSIAQHKEDISPEEMEKRARAAMAQMK